MDLNFSEQYHYQKLIAEFRSEVYASAMSDEIQVRQYIKIFFVERGLHCLSLLFESAAPRPEILDSILIE
jgi:hypothetical protein